MSGWVVIIFLLTWVCASIPLGIFVGRFIRHGKGGSHR